MMGGKSLLPLIQTRLTLLCQFDVEKWPKECGEHNGPKVKRIYEVTLKTVISAT